MVLRRRLVACGQTPVGNVLSSQGCAQSSYEEIHLLGQPPASRFLERPSGLFKVVVSVVLRLSPCGSFLLMRVATPIRLTKVQAHRYLVAEAEQPGGPYTIAVKNATTKYGEGGDFSLFVDDDSTGYLIYTSLAEAHSISIAPLNADFTQSLPLKNTAFLPGTDHTGCFEAPAMFKRRDVYFALVSVCSCFGVGGADVWVYTAAHPLGPYTRRADLGNAERSQQNYVFQVPLVDGDSYIWTGDRWKSTPDGEKAHDFQYWQPLNFSANVHPNGSKADVVIGSLLSAKTLPNFSLDLNAS